MRDPNNPCLFCNTKVSGIVHENEFAYASYDTYPVSQHHCLIIPKRHVVDYFQLSDDANNSVNVLLTRSDGAEVFKIMGHTQAATFGGNIPNFW